jgi:hypothetical protein
MLLLSGAVKDKMYDQTPVSATELIELFGLDVDLEKRSGSVHFTLTDKYVKPDRLNGGEKYPPGSFLRSLIQGTYEGNDVEIQYYNRKRIKREAGLSYEVFEPHQVRYLGKELLVPISGNKKNLERLVFFMLHHKCADSPLEGSRDKKYKVDDYAIKAKAMVDETELFVEVFGKISDPNVSMTMLRNKLAGMTGGLNVENMEDVEVKGKLVELIRRDISGFMKKWADASITFEGVLIRAKLMDLIREKPGSGGSVSWYYSPDVSAKYFQTGTQHITNSVPGQASMQALKEWFLADTSRIQKLSQIIGDYDQAVKASDNLTDALFEPSTVTPGAQVEEKPFNPAEAEVPELVAFGFEYEVLTTYKEADVTKVAFVKSGKPDKELLAVSSAKEYINETIVFFEDADNKALLGTLKNKIRGKLLGMKKK